MVEKIEYRVRPVTRYVVTRFHKSDKAGSCCSKGEFDSRDAAFSVAYALARDEHERLGWPVGDERMQYPDASEVLRSDQGEQLRKSLARCLAEAEGYLDEARGCKPSDVIGYDGWADEARRIIAVTREL